MWALFAGGTTEAGRVLLIGPRDADAGTATKAPNRTGTMTEIEDHKRAADRLQRSEAYLAEAQKLSHRGQENASDHAPTWIVLDL